MNTDADFIIRNIMRVATGRNVSLEAATALVFHELATTNPVLFAKTLAVLDREAGAAA